MKNMQATSTKMVSKYKENFRKGIKEICGHFTGEYKRKCVDIFPGNYKGNKSKFNR